MQEDHDGPEEIDQVLRRCQGIGVMSSLDLRASFWQVPLAHESRKYTGFSHQGYTYQYTSVPFGLKISSAALNRAAETILRDMRGSVIAFVDDWLVVSSTMEQHLLDLDELLTRISDENVTVNFDKFEPLRKEIRFVGFVLTPEGIQADEQKTEVIMNFPAPRTPTQSQRLLGMANFNARFTARLAEAAGPLIKLTKKGEPWKWGDAEIKAFHAVKQLFCKSLFLNHPVKGKGYVLYTDASSKALGAALCQEIEPGDVRIIYMASRTLKGAELNYYTTELELLAIVWALEKFRSYVYGQPVEVRTDHQALTFLRTSRFLSQRLLRWSLLIQDYNLKVKHIPGKENILAPTTCPDHRK
ncbi:unnamed protein product [Trichogramma brassicae]|uniref:RNA-directed DNA polymerase n=1 Tax=Trichogramma brassicae TaxID=86971 RepID=A0A6H5IED5_9HYME|nr:unnamed protein product [Trichogramma brassicae]